jgi:hypothetical protein
MPTQNALRKAKELRSPRRTWANYVAVAGVVMTHGPSALPYFAVRRRRALVGKLVEIAVTELNPMCSKD